MADSGRAGPGKVVKHYSPPLVLDDENRGPNGLRSLFEEQHPGGLRERRTRFFLETDFHGRTDPARERCWPIDTVPRRIKGMAQSGVGHEAPDRHHLEGQ